MSGGGGKRSGPRSAGHELFPRSPGRSSVRPVHRRSAAPRAAPAPGGDITTTARHRRPGAPIVAGTALAVLVPLAQAPAATAAEDATRTSARVDFQSQAAATFPGYTADHGQPYSDTTGSGWLDDVTGAPLSLVGNGRQRNSAVSPDKRYDTIVQMQQTTSAYGGTARPGRWEYALADGTYDVTVAVGDATAYNSTHTIVAEPGGADAVTIVDAVKLTSAEPFRTTTSRVRVSDGRLTLSPATGVNTKIAFVDVSPVVTAPVDTTAPVATVALSGERDASGAYAQDVTVTAAATDQGGSGLAGITYALDGGAPLPYTAPFSVAEPGAHTVVVTATDGAGNTGTASATWTRAAAAPAGTLVASSPDDAALGLPTPRLVFSTVRGRPAPPARSFTFTNTGGTPLALSGLATAGEDAGSFALAPGQPSSVTVPAGGTAQVSVVFTPTDPTNCPSSANPTAIADMVREARLTYSTPSGPGSVDVSGVVTCNVEGNNEPTLQQVVDALGYDVKTYRTFGNERFIGPQRNSPGSDEVYNPYFVPADASQPVTLTPVAHYGSRNTAASGYGRTGWISQGATGATGCSSTCKQLFLFPGDTASAYTANQELMPEFTGTTTFRPGGAFGLYHGDYGDVNYTDDGFNHARSTSGATITPLHHLHSIRVYPAYTADRRLVPNTWIVGVDITRVPSYKNNDFEDVVLVLRNAAPAQAPAPLPGAATTVNLAAGGTVGTDCGVTGFDGVLPNTAGTQCNAAAMSFTPDGLRMTSTAGQLADGRQQNALYKSFDASTGPFTVRARVKGPITGLTKPYQQVAAFFGPDQSNFVKAEVEFQGTGTDPHATFFFSEKGTARTIATTSVPAVTSASTVDLIVQGNTSVPDPIAAASDPNKVRSYPLTQVSVSYAIDGGAPVRIGTTTVSPADVSRWFGRSAKAGVLVSGGGSTTPYTATVSSFAVTAQ
ncbi:OmpL47-type beta-barrel domain-containing protein [Kineococcus sp. SYSU DK005]|uniref:OmpL47-type beta-barrel domain-containing protein n=1 Tax=Kineococcus sp. SYSU DK005 TaxID=3383126 RepID=UPI003D7C439D